MSTTEILPDDEVLRVARRGRLLVEMEAAGVDVFVLGREANARYVSGTPRLWLAGSRPFGLGCVLVRDGGAVHLLSTWDEGVPEEIPHENLYGISFNSRNFLAVLRDIEGADEFRTVATDGLTAAAARLLPKAFPAAELVDGEPLLRRARRVKTPEEIEAIGVSVRMAERAVAAARSALGPGVTERQLTAVFMEEMVAAGTPTPSNQDVAWITSREHPWQRGSRDTPAAEGDLVAFEAGVIAGGYVGELGRTVAVGGQVPLERGDFARWGELWSGLLEACRPGAALSGLLDAYPAAGLPEPPMPVARGLGLGFDLPLVTHALPQTASHEVLEENMVLALSAFVFSEGVGSLFGQEPVVLTADGPVFLSTDPCVPEGVR
jgi:Xaa-Pro aminopeptidase